MKNTIHFFKDIFDLNVLILYLFSAYLLFFIDSKALNIKGLKRESRFSKVMGIVYAALSICLYIISKILEG